MASWKNHKLVIAETPGCGKGIFARDSIPCGEVLFVMGGTILTNEEEDVLSERLLDKPIEIADGFSIGPRNFHDLKRMPQHYVNHSCRPNAGFRGQLFLMALRDIEAGEQIAYDYAMCARSGGREPFRMECRCEAPDCRGVITGDDWMIPELQERYAGYFQPYLQEKIDAMRRGDPQAS
jgi:SET domain-containing protein